MTYEDEPMKRTSLFSVERVDEAIVRPTIEECHYLKRWPHPLSLPFAYRLIVAEPEGRATPAAASDGRPWGVVVMKKCQHHKQVGLFGFEGLPTAWQVLDLARVWIHPALQSCRFTGPDRKGQVRQHSSCVFSRMTALVLRRCQRDWVEHHPPVYPHLPYHIELVLSYCDRAHHQGTGYKASGFTHFGETSDKTKDIYIRRLSRPRWTCGPRPSQMMLSLLAEYPFGLRVESGAMK